MILSLLFSLSGIVTFIIGFNRKKSGGPPECHACGLVLFDHMTNQVIEADICPDCGTPIKKSTGISINAPFFLAGGALMVVAAASLFLFPASKPDQDTSDGMTTFTLSFNEDGSVKSSSSSTRSSRKTNSKPQASQAQREIDKLLSAQNLDQAYAATLVQRVFKEQTDSEKPWDPAWGNLLMHLREQGLVTDVAWLKYHKQGIFLKTSVRKTVNIGDPVPVKFELKLRMAGDNKHYYDVSTKRLRFKGYQSGGNAHSMGASLDYDFSGEYDNTIRLSPNDQINELEAGRQTLKFDCRIRFLGTKDSITPPDPWFVSREHVIDFKAANDPVIEIIQDDKIKQQIRKAIVINTFEIFGRPAIYMNIKSPPTNLAYDILIDDGKSPPWKLGQLERSAGAPSKEINLFAKENHKVSSTHVDITFKPNSSLLKQTIDGYEMGDEIIFKKVKVRLPGMPR